MTGKKAKHFKRELYALYLAYKDPRVPWYAFSPIDLIPDPIPVLGYLDDLILIPLGIALVIKLIPPDVLNECRERAGHRDNENKPKNWVAACVIVLTWIMMFILIGYYCVKFFRSY